MINVNSANMSLRIITKLIHYMREEFKADKEGVVIKTIEIDDGVYTIEVIINEKQYSIRHFEPLKMEQDVNYGMGYFYDCCLFDKEKGHYVPLRRTNDDLAWNIEKLYSTSN